jgi:hypothetical protein
MSRIYIVGTPDGDIRLIRAKTKNQAMSHFLTNNITIKVASQDELLDAVKDGCEVENYKHADQIELDLPEEA